MTSDPIAQRTDTGLDRTRQPVGETLGRADAKVASKEAPADAWFTTRGSRSRRRR